MSASEKFAAYEATGRTIAMLERLAKDTAEPTGFPRLKLNVDFSISEWTDATNRYGAPDSYLASEALDDAARAIEGALIATALTILRGKHRAQWADANAALRGPDAQP